MEAEKALGMLGVRYATVRATEREQTAALVDAAREMAAMLTAIAEDVERGVAVELGRARTAWSNVERLHATVQARREVISLLGSAGLAAPIEEAHARHNAELEAAARRARDARGPDGAAAGA